MSNLVSSFWDVVVIGAGPSGSFAASLLAQKNLKVLLVDKASFPRSKVCGSCLNLHAIQELQKAGLFSILSEEKAQSLNCFRMSSAGEEIELGLKGGFVLSRESLDFALIKKAQNKGVSFLGETKATVLGLEKDRRIVFLECEGKSFEVFAKTVLVSDGLAGSSLSHLSHIRRYKNKHSKIGVGTVLESEELFYEPGAIYMAHGREGYVGIARLEDGRLDIAAALDPKIFKGESSPVEIIKQLIESAGWPEIRNLSGARFQGTPALTQKSSKLALERVFMIGDAAGYIEPFTGEGMAWAFSSARLVLPWVERSSKGWSSSLMWGWKIIYGFHFGVHRGVCRLISKGLRFYALVPIILKFLRHFPFVAVPLRKFLRGEATYERSK